jgi:hypothetical protein
VEEQIELTGVDSFATGPNSLDVALRKNTIRDLIKIKRFGIVKSVKL